MTEQEVLKNIEARKESFPLDSYVNINCDEEYSIVKKALEKQIPKKATHPYEHCMNSQCPACGDWEWSTYKSQWKPNYCPKCGQALDWSDENV